MAQVTGLGGIFFKSRDVERLYRWYERHLGIRRDAQGYVGFEWREKERPDTIGYTAWGPFKHDTTYFDPTTASYMVNYRVDDLDGILRRLREAGVAVDEKTQDEDYGRFGWARDPDGVRFELWQPK